MSGSWPMVVFDLLVVVGLVAAAKAVSDTMSVGAGWVWFLLLSASFVFCFVAVPLRVLLVRQKQSIMRQTSEARRQASTDPLTGLPNRRSTEGFVADLLAEGIPFTVAVCDLDHFKNVNDGFGHDVGDSALVLFARTVRRVVRHTDIVVRHGGEEFLVILPRTFKDQAVGVLDRVRLELAVAVADTGSPAYTFSAGVADTTERSDWTALLQVADQRLLHAKRLGRDRVLASIA